MAKNDLLGASLWDAYSNKVTTLMNNPNHQGEISEEEAAAHGNRLIVADFGAESCGDAVRLYWEVDPKTDVIVNSKFKSFGCGTAIASSDIMTELCIGKTVKEAVKITNIDVEFALRDNPETPAVPPQKMHCSVMAYDVIKKAAALYMGVDADSFEEEIIVCECARVSLKTLQEVIRLNDLTTIEQITDYTKAGGFCKSCIKPGGHEKREYYLVDILRDTRREMDEEKMKAAADAGSKGNFESMTLVQQIKAIDAQIDESIRQFLIMDGGDMEVIDVKPGDDYIDVYIRYLGACNGCASSATGTLYAIESTLKEKLSKKIRVLPI
ncbi:MAG: iron-sulfur cluster assembly scaffold protein NifU [Sulfurimonas sp. RIFOXYD12_FULL_33_39]|uniref:iron-sulfur cluster assembly scaffold protein n=1 Tax=unclassified Sulfurimonas TaxID=2623549 RepID=UPI0008D2BF67|nr:MULTISPECIES: iron-sulfur cluster assembly scaffold protein [unclassified Sulfurimonas]OHE03925.1 MAG: iron-sulfur cluster assembly scaffold protein NifU [Sulfurimonas sp. RIFCSPLOWO2_12_FULL_34_6]OHE09900.1 MAG: iron-sulfur cluster assembly scaffold protein NifU [Sulfurimonas sp. RIFOXYD12_FULL_33_39]OHE13592.1 MAG: iron-sulfur cluster assembly scaffold protein NifU [Sulfurimonas sp. RIFOXYD2_FULL_34_21]DAB28215.1 MAG TPA: iron-sulfur cluster assembly scaffold protein NifU [Sulfurimonas sp.